MGKRWGGGRAPGGGGVGDALVSDWPLGLSAVVMLFSGPLSDKYGRKGKQNRHLS